MKRLPCGIQNFESLIKDGYLYVDKTSYIRDLISSGRHYFLARPRRFGKSLLISTIEAYFQGKSELFSGLAIAEGKTEWPQYPIFHIDLSPEEYSSRSCLENRLNFYLTQWEKLYGVTDAAISLSERFEGCIEHAYIQTGKRVVILVDEYDKPLLHSLDDDELQDEYRKILKAFYGVIKSMDGRIKFSLLTGVTKFSKVSIFSDLNNLTDISRDKRYATICGLTLTEIQQQLQPYMEGICREESLSEPELMAKMREMYDGYRFVENQTEGVYNPYSVMNALEKERLGSYWFETGTPNMIVSLLKKNGYVLEDLTNVPLDSETMDSRDNFGLHIAPLLYQSGYLTIRNFDKENGLYWLDFPNQEVQDGFFKFLVPYYTSIRRELSTFAISQFVEDVRAGRTEQFMTRLQSFFADFQYDAQCVPEAHFRNVLFILCKLLGIQVDAEYMTSDGRIDLLIRASRFIYIIECKIDSTAEVALKQIKRKEYNLPWTLDGRKIIGIGVNFDTEKRRPEGWLIEELTIQYTTQKKNILPKRTNTTRKKLTTTQKSVRDYLQKNPSATMEDVASALDDITVDGVKYTINVLKKKCGLHREGGRKEGKWLFEETI